MEGPFNMNSVDFLRGVPMYYAQKRGLTPNWLRSDWPFHSSLIFRDSSHWIFIFVGWFCVWWGVWISTVSLLPPSTSPASNLHPSDVVHTFPSIFSPQGVDLRQSIRKASSDLEIVQNPGPKSGSDGFSPWVLMRVYLQSWGGCFLVGYVLYVLGVQLRSQAFGSKQLFEVIFIVTRVWHTHTQHSSVWTYVLRISICVQAAMSLKLDLRISGSVSWIYRSYEFYLTNSGAQVWMGPQSPVNGEDNGESR